MMKKYREDEVPKPKKVNRNDKDQLPSVSDDEDEEPKPKFLNQSYENNYFHIKVWLCINRQVFNILCRIDSFALISFPNL